MSDNCVVAGGRGSGKTAGIIQAAYDRGVECGKPKWISVMDRLPEIGKSVILYFGETDNADDPRDLCAVGWTGEHAADGRRYWKCNSGDGYYCEVDGTPTHWMPLPEPPKEADHANELKPCPFCGSKAVISELEEDLYLVRCTLVGCPAMEGATAGSVDEAKSVWNRRTADEPD